LNSLRGNENCVSPVLKVLILKVLRGGSAVEEYLTEEKFILNIIRKSVSDEILKNNYLDYF
jgi:hypothetical protein